MADPGIGFAVSQLVGLQARITNWLKEESGNAALDYARRVRDEGLRDGDIDPDADVFVIRGSSTQRRSSLDAINPLYLPFPPSPGYQIAFAKTSVPELIEAVEFTYNTLVRRSPSSSTGTRKNHDWKYHKAFELRWNGKLIPGPSSIPEARVKETDVFEIVNVAPYASKLEKGRYSGQLFHATARQTAAKFGPAIAVASEYINSDLRGYTYGKGTGGPEGRQRVYQLPRILIGIAGQSGISTRIGSPRMQKRRRR